MTRAVYPRLGDERLSDKGKEDGAGNRRAPASKKKSAASKEPAPGATRARAGDLGRALRSAYDDTVREPVPDEFLNLLGKLS